MLFTTSHPLLQKKFKMNMSRYLLLLPLFLFCSCSDSSRPSDLPRLYSCTITVTQGGVPLEGALVELGSPDSQKYNASGTTDASGNAMIMTYGHSGAPVGKYKILVSKIIEDDIVYGTNVYGEQTIDSFNRYKLVDDRYSNMESTPHEIEVTTKKTQTTIDVGEAVRKKLSPSPY